MKWYWARLGLVAGVAAVSTAGCGNEDAAVAPPAALPRVLSAEAGANPHNGLALVVTFTAEHADSARLRYSADDGSIDSTPFTPISGDLDTVVALGLRPATGYRYVLELEASAGRVLSDTLLQTTPSLPPALGRVGITTSGTAGPGLNLTSLAIPDEGVFAFAFDSAGAIRWYRRFEGAERFGGELKRQPNGNFTLYRGSSTGVEKVPGHYVEFTPAGDSVGAITVAPPRYVDNHDLLITTSPEAGDRFHLFTYDHRVSDLRAIGGPRAVELAGHQLVRLREDGTTEFEWNAWDHVSFEEWVEGDRPESRDTLGRDFDHPNSLALDPDGNYIVSFRRLNQIMKIDAVSGEVIWRVGGVRSDIAFADDPLNGFNAQHSAEILPGGNLLLYDNGNQHQPPETRAVEYALDFGTRTARLVWQFRHVPPIFTRAVGSTQRLPNGNTLVGYGWAGRAVEVSTDATPRWSADVTLDGAPALMYRVLRIETLY